MASAEVAIAKAKPATAISLINVLFNVLSPVYR
jgi:hypothetical protein